MNIFTKWQHFAKSGHTGYNNVVRTSYLIIGINMKLKLNLSVSLKNINVFGSVYLLSIHLFTHYLLRNKSFFSHAKKDDDT